MTEIWIEGYNDHGNIGRAYMIASSEKTNFDEAVIEELSDKLDKDRNGNIRKPYTIWLCKLFDNENDARKSFG